MNDPLADHATSVGQFYDAAWGTGPSLAALAHGEGHIGQECLLTADEIQDFARQAGIAAGTAVLDIGSGKGGPACYLAQQFGCRVFGVDVSTVGHAQAQARASDLGLADLVTFRLGDIHRIELPSGAFDVIVGFDAWCHIPDRPGLLRRCAALLRPGGRLAFWDHVERRSLSDEQRRNLCAQWRFAGLETPATYLEAVRAAGLEVVSHDETSRYASRFYARLVEAFLVERAQFVGIGGPERYAERLQRLRLTERLASTETLGQLACIAVKPEIHS
jgi:cyclopropane fatty-acyl-phospholipid synthase-like methyltransferase